MYIYDKETGHMTENGCWPPFSAQDNTDHNEKWWGQTVKLGVYVYTCDQHIESTVLDSTEISMDAMVALLKDYSISEWKRFSSYQYTDVEAHPSIYGRNQYYI